MNALEQITQQISSLAEHHLPEEAAVPVFIAAPAALVVLGLLTAVLGAKLARPSIALGFAIGGATIGVVAGQALAVSMPLCAAIGAVVFGISGFVLLRLWVGVATCVLFAAIAAGSYGAHHAMPHLRSYSEPAPPAITTPEYRFSTPEPRVQELHLNPEFNAWLEDLYTHVTSKEVNLERNMVLSAVAAGVFGLLLGLMAVRFTLVILTSVMGTAALIAGASTLLCHHRPELYHAALAHPGALAIACGAFLLGSLVLQALLTRSHKSRKPANDKA
jgi:hypothetical protein